MPLARPDHDDSHGRESKVPAAAHGVPGISKLNVPKLQDDAIEQLSRYAYLLLVAFAVCPFQSCIVYCSCRVVIGTCRSI